MSVPAWEKRWKYVSGAWPEIVFYDGSANRSKKVCDVWADDDESTHAVGELISAAPEMACLLLELHAVDMRGCRWCGGSGGAVPHRDDCRLVAVLRKAGCAP